MKSIIKELFETDTEELFNQAKRASKNRKTILCSPNIIRDDCTTMPVCNHCKWENMKKNNLFFHGVRSLKQIKDHAKLLQEEGIDRMFMPSGWMGFSIPDYFYECIKAVKENFSVEVYGLFGAIDRQSLSNLKKAGMDGYLCGLESPNEAVYRKFRPGGDSLKDRINTLKAAKELDLKVWSGFLVGFGETEEDVVDGLEILKDLDVDSLSILPFIPAPYTKMMGDNPTNPLYWAKVMAVSRIYMDKPDMFSDSTEGLYSFYGFLGGANGFYVFPGMNFTKRLINMREN